MAPRVYATKGPEAKTCRVTVPLKAETFQQLGLAADARQTDKASLVRGLIEDHLREAVEPARER